MSRIEDPDTCELDERVASPKPHRNRSPEEVFPYLRIPQLTVAGRPQVSPVRLISHKNLAHTRKRSVSHEIERYRHQMQREPSLRESEAEQRNYPWLTAQAEKRLTEIERCIVSKIATAASKSKPAHTELSRLWTSLHLGKTANYVEFISVLTALGLIGGSEVQLINSLWAAVGGDSKQAVTIEDVDSLLQSQIDETRCSDDSLAADTPVRRTRRMS